MGHEGFNQAPDEEAPRRIEKERRFEDAVHQVETITDGRGKGIDAGIKESVALLSSMDVNTTQSCEGHEDWGTGGPYIDIEAKEATTLNGRLRELDKQKGKGSDDVEIEKIRGEILKLNLEERRKVIPILEEFYKDRSVPYDIKLGIKQMARGWSRIENQGVEFQDIENDPAKKKEMLQKFQAEMAEFTRFMKDKFFA